MALESTKALTTVDRVRRELGLASFTADEVAFVEDTISDLSAEAETFLNRGPLCYDAAIVERVRSAGGQRIFVTRRPIVELTSVHDVDDDGTYDVDADEIDLDDVTVEKEGRTGALFKRSRWPSTGEVSPGPSVDPVVGSEGENLRVQYAGGWVLPLQATTDLPRTLPRDVEKAIVLTVVDFFQQRGTSRNIAASSALSASVTFVNQSTRKDAGGVGSFGPEAAALLRQHRRVPMGRVP